MTRAHRSLTDGTIQLVDVARGLKYMHDLHVVHGDLKGVQINVSLLKCFRTHIPLVYAGEHPDQQ